MFIRYNSKVIENVKNYIYKHKLYLFLMNKRLN